MTDRQRDYIIIPPSRRRATIAEIQSIVANRFHVPVGEMTSACRERRYARPRQVAMYLARTVTHRSLPEIGRRFGGRDHTTAIHAVRQIEKLRAADWELDSDIKALEEALS